MNELEEFHAQLIADIRNEADASGLFVEEAFFEKTGDLLVEAGELDAADWAFSDGRFERRSYRISGSGGDPRDASGVLSLILCDFEDTSIPRSIYAAGTKAHFEKLLAFLAAARDEEWRHGLDETSEAFRLADLVATTWRHVEKVKLIIVTNAVNKAKADAKPVGSVSGRPVTCSVWDLERLHRYYMSGQSREDVEIRFRDDFGGSIPVLKASADSSPLDSYMAVISGKQLGEIYDKWGTRLLEANVRSFLQARGKVNQGIRSTLEEEPEMFFAYNNGLTATADSVEIEMTPEGAQLVTAKNLQIVNGGQTTASIHAARKARPKKSLPRLDDVYVQMKLNVVPSELTEDVVPRISEFANSQNKVNAADFFSNHPFHVRMEEFSRRVLAPAAEGYRESKWFYERARGQYPDARGRLTDAQRKKFDLEYPRSQYFTKTDLAKFENSWAELPHIVSSGAQKNFAGPSGFATRIGREWTKSEVSFDETWFRRAIAKAIIFRRLEKLVPQQDWYEGGYRANIVTYTMAKVAHDARERDMEVDLDAVWRLQLVPRDLEAALLVAAGEAHRVITHPPEGVRNFSEWAKKQACWEQLRSTDIEYESGLENALVEPEALKSIAKEAHDDRNLTDSVSAQIRVVDLGGSFWKRAAEFGLSEKLVSPMEAGVLRACSRIPAKLPTERQSEIAVGILERLEKAGLSAGGRAAAE